MATIDNLDLDVHNLYALRTKMLEQVNNQWRLDQASSIPPQTRLVDIVPKMTEMDILFGATAFISLPWAYFNLPPRYRNQRRSPFAFFRIVPLLGSLEDQEKEEQKLNSVLCEHPEEIEEKKVIGSCLSQIKKINGWMGHIVGRIGQFLQG